MRKAINIISVSGIIGLFAWISFFAPILTGNLWQSGFLFVLIALLSVLVCLDRKAGYKSIFTKQDIPFWILLLTMLGGLVNGINPKVIYYHFWTFVFIIPFLYFFAKSTFREEYGIMILRAICLMGLLVCILGIVEFITGESFIYTKWAYSFCYEVFKGWRMMSTHIHPTPLGTYLVAIFPLAIVLALKEKKPFLKSSAIISALIIFISIILTFSRGAFLGVFMAMVTMLFFLLKRNRIFFILSLILLIAVIITVSSFLSHYGHMAFFRISLPGLYHLAIYSRKIDRFISIGNILKDHPFFGLGFDHYRIFFDYYLPNLANTSDRLSKVPDCMYIIILTETGLVGFTGFMLFISFLFKNIFDRLKALTKHEDRLLLLGFLSGFIGILCTFLTYDALYWVAPNCLFWAYVGILSFLSR